MFYAFNNKGSVYDYFLGKSDTRNKPLATVQNNAANTNELAKPENNTIHIFSNPSNGTFKIVTDKIYKEAEVTITDFTGKKIYQQTFNNSSSVSIKLNVAKGVYFITVKTDSGTEKQKLIIQ